jgi:hypothetical protein
MQGWMVHLDYKNSSYGAYFINVKFVIKCDIINDVKIFLLLFNEPIKSIWTRSQLNISKNGPLKKNIKTKLEFKWTYENKV